MKENNVEQIGTLLWLYHQSYLGEINVRPRNLGTLVETINKIRRRKGSDIKKVHGGRVQYSEEYLYIEYLSDALEKLGFIFFARDKIKKDIKNLHACKYHIYNSIFDCKALLDTIAGLLNHHYKLGEKRAGVDLKRQKYIRKLADKNPLLAREIGEFEIWTKAISDWRNTLIHRHGVFLFFVKDNKFLMPVKPLRFVDAALFQVPTVDPIDFCEENIRGAKLILEIVCRHIQKDLVDRLSDFQS